MLRKVVFSIFLTSEGESFEGEQLHALPSCLSFQWRIQRGRFVEDVPGTPEVSGHVLPWTVAWAMLVMPIAPGRLCYDHSLQMYEAVKCFCKN